MLKRMKLPPRYNLLFMVLPFMVVVFLFHYVPIFGWAYAFFDYIPGVPLLECDFVGLEYFTYIFTDKVNMLRVMKNTLIFAVIGLLITPLPMLFAICLNEIRNSRVQRFIQSTTTLPNFLSWIIVFSISFTLFSNEGLLNVALQELGMIEKPLNVLGNADGVYVFQTILGLWKSLGWSSIIYFAAIAGIDPELYQAAEIDGAGYLAKALHITLPALSTTYIVLLILSVSNFLNTGFEQYYLFKNSMTAKNIEVLDVYTYRIGLAGADYSYGIAIGIMKTIVSLFLLTAANLASRKIRGASIF